MTDTIETVEVAVTAQEAMFMRAGARPFVYRPLGEKAWRLGWALPGLDVRAFLRERLEPSLGPLEVEVRPKRQPSDVSAGAWQFELDQRRAELFERNNMRVVHQMPHLAQA